MDWGKYVIRNFAVNVLGLHGPAMSSNDKAYKLSLDVFSKLRNDHELFLDAYESKQKRHASSNKKKKKGGKKIGAFTTCFAPSSVDSLE